jgi:hypothetical protein
MENSNHDIFVVLESGVYSDYTWHVFLRAPHDIDLDAAYEEAYKIVHASQSLEGYIYIGHSDVREEYVKALEKRGALVLDVTPIHLGEYEACTPDEMREAHTQR